MNSNEISELIKRFDWSQLNRIYGCAHSSIIGFITYEWLKFSERNSVIDGAPSPNIGSGRTGQTNADLLLCSHEKPYIPVEVETNVIKYPEKLKSLFDYKNAFPTIEFGLFYMTNLKSGIAKYQHNWEKIKQDIINRSGSDKMPIALISSIKRKIDFQVKNNWSELLKRNDYSSWEIVSIDYWICDLNGEVLHGNLWRIK
jgi:hypothetical protein